MKQFRLGVLLAAIVVAATIGLVSHTSAYAGTTTRYQCSDCEWSWWVMQDWCNDDEHRDGSGTCEMQPYHIIDNRCVMIDDHGCCMEELASTSIGLDGSVAYARSGADTSVEQQDGKGRILTRWYSSSGQREIIESTQQIAL